MILDVSTYIVHIQIINGGKGKPNIVGVVRNENKKYPLICFHRKDLLHFKMYTVKILGQKMEDVKLF